MEERNIVPHNFYIKKEDRHKKYGNKAMVLWFTGLSGSGKSSIANCVEKKLFELGHNSYILDGDGIRSGLNRDLGFCNKDRFENIRRAAEVAKLFVDAGIIVLASFISPLQKERELARSLIGKDAFFEVFVDCPIEICEKRDVKGIYKKYRAGKINNFVGIDIPFEEPPSPDLIIKSSEVNIEEATEKILRFILLKIKF